MSNYFPNRNGPLASENNSLYKSFGGKSQNQNSRAYPEKTQQMMLMSTALKQHLPKSQNQKYRQRKNLSMLGSSEQITPAKTNY